MAPEPSPLPAEPAPETPRPGIRIASLSIRDLKAIRRLDLPTDGLGWGGSIPPVVLVGGVNGSGKTTLFELFTSVFRLLEAGPQRAERLALVSDPAFADAEVTIDIGLDPALGFERVRFVMGSAEGALGAEPTDAGDRDVPTFGMVMGSSGVRQPLGMRLGPRKSPAQQISSSLRSAARSDRPRPAVLFLPSDDRGLVVFDEPYKAPGKLDVSKDLVYRWRRPGEWKQSLEAVLYAARWHDLNAREAGTAESGLFDAFASELSAFSNGTRRLRWTASGELVVETASGVTHGLDALSSGEKQILVLTAELNRRWRPGSLVMIDEPELHLHDAWQAKLFERIVALQRERGGQVWLATQSNFLFGLGEAGSRVILGGTPP